MSQLRARPRFGGAIAIARTAPTYRTARLHVKLNKLKAAALFYFPMNRIVLLQPYRPIDTVRSRHRRRQTDRQLTTSDDNSRTLQCNCNVRLKMVSFPSVEWLRRNLQLIRLRAPSCCGRLDNRYDLLSVGSALRHAVVTVARNVQLVPNWHGLCSLLNLTADDIDDIEARHPTSSTDRCYDSLVRWAQAAADDDGSERSVPALIQLLRRGRYQQIAGIPQSETRI